MSMELHQRMTQAEEQRMLSYAEPVRSSPPDTTIARNVRFRRQLFRPATASSESRFTASDISPDVWVSNFLDTLTQPPYDAVKSVVVFGPSGAAKTVWLLNLMRVLKTNEYLQWWSTTHGIDISHNLILFGHCATASKLPLAPSDERLPRHLRVPAEYGHGGYPPWGYRRISSLQWHLIQEHVLHTTDTDRLRILYVEGSAPCARPAKELIYSETEPVHVVRRLDEPDRVSAAYTILVHPDTAPYSELVCFRRDMKVRAAAVDFRSNLDPHTLDASIDSFFTGPVRYLITRSDGQEVDAIELPLEEKVAFIQFIQAIGAPPKGIDRSDAEIQGSILRRFRQRTAEHIPYRMRKRSFQEYVRSIASQLNREHFDFAINPLLQNRPITIDLDAILSDKNLVARIFPELVPMPLRGLYLDKS